MKKQENQILFVSPYFSEKIWGSDNLKQYGYKLPSKHIGEAWAISGYKNKSSIVLNGKYKGMNLYDLYHKYRKEMFGNWKSPEYPLLTKLLDCNQSLSVQVHPLAKYAKQHFNEPAKNECWYVINAKPNAKIIYGHNAKNKAEFKQMVQKGEWKKLLKEKPVKKGDLIYVPAGTIHALNDGLLIYELQQSSDITFRLYDYDRQKIDPSRKLHTQESIVNTVVPFTNPKIIKNRKYLVKVPSFSLSEINNNKLTSYSWPDAKWLQCTVISGNGKIKEFNNQSIKKGDSFLVVGNKKMELTITGKVKVLVGMTN